MSFGGSDIIVMESGICDILTGHRISRWLSSLRVNTDHSIADMPTKIRNIRRLRPCGVRNLACISLAAFDFRHIRDGLFLIYCVLMFSRKVTCRPIGGRSHHD